MMASSSEDQRREEEAAAAAKEEEKMTEMVHKTKVIQFLGRTTPIILQNDNGPCPLLSICMYSNLHSFLGFSFLSLSSLPATLYLILTRIRILSNFLI